MADLWEMTKLVEAFDRANEARKKNKEEKECAAYAYLVPDDEVRHAMEDLDRQLKSYINSALGNFSERSLGSRVDNLEEHTQLRYED